MENYIIDFERINQLTSHQKDTDEGYVPFHVFNTTRNLIKQYMETYQNYRNSSTRHRTVTDEQYQEAIEILHFNKILIDKSDIRDMKIDEVLK